MNTTNTWKVVALPPDTDLNTPEILQKTIEANRYLAELKGMCNSIPNQDILINTLSLQEAKDSSEIENIITTHDALFRADLFEAYVTDASAKEVQDYARALRTGFHLISEDKAVTIRHILKIQEIIESHNAGFRKLPGTELKNPATDETVFIPPQSEEEIKFGMHNLELFINDEELSSLDPLIKMALIHYQFESIHPFYDGNGRTGRIINILYLVQQNLLDIPVLYLSRYIIKTKGTYYRLLQKVRTENDWHSWVLYMLEGVVQTSRQTLEMIIEIRDLMMSYKHLIRKDFKFYSQDVINHLFRHPYTKIKHFQNDLKISRLTARKYLEELTNAGFLQKIRVGNSNYYINGPLYHLLANPPQMKMEKTENPSENSGNPAL